MIIDPVKYTYVRCAASRLANQGGASEHFHVVAEVFRCGKRSARCQYVGWLIRQVICGDRRARPRLPGRIRSRAIYVLRMIEQVSSDQHNHSTIPAAIVAQVENNRVSAVQRGHRGPHLPPANRWVWKGIQFQVADLLRQDFQSFDRAVLLLQNLPVTRKPFTAQSIRAIGQRRPAKDQFQVRVMAYISHLGGEEPGKGLAVRHRVIIPMLLVRQQSIGRPARYARIDVMFLQIYRYGLNNAASFGGVQFSAGRNSILRKRAFLAALQTPRRLRAARPRRPCGSRRQTNPAVPKQNPENDRSGHRQHTSRKKRSETGRFAPENKKRWHSGRRRRCRDRHRWLPTPILAGNGSRQVGKQV